MAIIDRWNEMRACDKNVKVNRERRRHGIPKRQTYKALPSNATGSSKKNGARTEWIRSRL